MKRIKRRAMLKGTIFGGTVAIGLPMLEAMLPRIGAAQSGVDHAETCRLSGLPPTAPARTSGARPANMDLGGHIHCTRPWRLCRTK